MNRSKVFVLGGLLSATLLLPAMPALADPKGSSEHHEWENHGQHKGWENDHSKRFDRSTHDRRDFGHAQRELHRDGRWDDHRGQPVRHDPRRDGRFDNLGHHNKPEIRQDFKDIHSTRNEIHGDRADLRKDYTELRKDRVELRKDIRNGASKTEIMKDRQEIRGDVKDISGDRVELRKDQGTLGSQRRELKSDLVRK